MIVKFIGEGTPLSLLHGKEYEVLSLECGWYRIIDESNEDYLYPARAFEVVEDSPAPPTIEPEPLPAGITI